MLKDRRLCAALVSIAWNVVLVILKLVGARLSLSAAMRADALHSASDILISGLVFLSICFTLRNSGTENRPARDEQEDRDEGDDQGAIGNAHLAENVTALFVSLLLIAAALGFLLAAFTGPAASLQCVPAAIAIVWVCIVLSYLLARYKIRVGREEGSVSLEADGHHSRMDMYSSIVVFVGLVGDLIGIRLDALAAAAVSFLVLKAGLEVLGSSAQGLAATEMFTYQGLGWLRDTRLGQKTAPVFERMFGHHVDRTRQVMARGARWVARHQRRAAAGALLLGVAAYLGSGFFCIQPGEVGVVLRCGKLVDRPAPPGLHYRLPSPISTLHRVRPRAVRRLEFGFRTVARRTEVNEPSAYLWESMHRGGIYEKVEPEAIMLTGDVNEVDLNAVVEYCVADGASAGFLFNLADSEALVRAATENTIRRVVGTKQLTDVLTTARRAIEQQVFAGLQALLDQYGACVTVTAVHLQDVHPPVDVVPAFRRVATAREDRITRINEAEAYRNWTIPMSRGLASRILADGVAYRAERRANAEGDAAYFEQVRQAFREAPDAVAFTMYTDCLQGTLPPLRKLVFSDDISSVAAGNTLQRFFMMGEFLKKSPPGDEKGGLSYPRDEE